MRPMTKAESRNIRAHMEFVGQACSSLEAQGQYIQPLQRLTELG